MKQVFNPLAGSFDTVLSDAAELPYDNTTSGLTAADVKAAIDEVQGNIDALPDPITYKGTWNASTNTPTLANTDTNVTGFLYQVSVAGSVDFGAGSISFDVGDKVVNDGTIWDKWDLTDAVTSVNSQTGAVVLDTDDVTEATALYFTDTRARTAAVVDSTAGSEINQAPSVSAIKTYIPTVAANLTLSNLSTPTAVNQHLLPSGSKNLGSAASPWSTVILNSSLNAVLSGTAVASVQASTLTSPLTESVTGAFFGNQSATTTPNKVGFFTENRATLNSRGILISTGYATANDSGDLILGTGPAGGTRGSIKLVDGSEGTSGHIWTSNATDGSGSWAAPPSAYLSTSSVSTATNAVSGKTYLADTSGGAFAITLPAPAADAYVIVKDSGGAAETFNLTVSRNASENIDNAAADYVINSDNGSATFVSDGTDWFVL